MLGKAIPAVDRSPLSRLEGNFALFTAVRADCLEHLAGAAGEVVSTSLASKSVAIHYVTYAVVTLQPYIGVSSINTHASWVNPVNIRSIIKSSLYL